MNTPCLDAARVLQRHWDGVPPVPVVAIARRMGAEVLSAQLGGRVYARLLFDAHGAVIFTSSADPPQRTRMAVALMFGHFIRLQEQGAGAVCALRDSFDPDDEGEAYARAFAHALLMPDSRVRALAGQLSEPKLAEVFDVSITAICSRLAELSVTT